VVPGGWVPAVKFLVEELGADVNARDSNGYNAVHHAAARGDNELIQYLVSKGADVMAVSRRGQTTVDMANGPVQRISPFPATIALLEGLGAKNNHNCVSC
jgi:ankyrin repeat protein